MDFIKFLGTAGARFVMIKQLRSSGGIWIHYRSTDILIDPGPGSIVRCSRSRPKLDPSTLDAIILTHKHLDHSGDINVMIEAMTEGGFKKRGFVFAPPDALTEGGVIIDYLRGFPQEIRSLGKGKFEVKDVRFQVPCQNIHSVMTYGLKFYLGDEVVSFVSDTKFSRELFSLYADSTILVLNVVFYERRENFEHLCLEDAITVIQALRPRRTILTHFGMTMLKHKPKAIEEDLRSKLGLDIVCAYDGMTFVLAPDHTGKSSLA